jgi:hypothetical protein
MQSTYMDNEKNGKKTYNKPIVKTYGPVEVITEFP